MVRTDATLAPEALIAAVRRQLHDIDPGLPLSHVRTMSEQLAESVAPPRFQAILPGAFSGLALLLGSAGIYGVLSYAVVCGLLAAVGLLAGYLAARAASPIDPCTALRES